MACIFENGKLHSFIPPLKSRVLCLWQRVWVCLLLKAVLTIQGHENRLFSVLTLNKTFHGYFGILREVKWVSTLLTHYFPFFFLSTYFKMWSKAFSALHTVQCFIHTFKQQSCWYKAFFLTDMHHHSEMRRRKLWHHLMLKQYPKHYFKFCSFETCHPEVKFIIHIKGNRVCIILLLCPKKLTLTN